METFEAIRTVLAVREYEDKPIPANIVHKIVEAAHLTASSMNKQPWHFIVVEDREMLQKLGGAASTGPYIAQAPLAIAVAIEQTKFAVSDASRAIQSMILTAWSEGVGSNWVGFRGLDKLHALLNIPDDLEVLAVIPFGYPTRNIGKGQKQRKPLSQVAHREQFNQPFE
jgi:nitroreductase